MKKITTIALLVHLFLITHAQTSTNLAVYQILQERCASCHNHTNPEAGLDLEGQGATIEEQAAHVRNSIVGISPENEYAAAEGHQLIYPGRIDKSFLFQKINKGLDQAIQLSSEEGENMPPDGEVEMSDEEKEIIRQWILFGAPEEGEVVDPKVIYDYYHVNGLAAYDTPPPAPDPSEGFQIKIGPFFLNPAGQEGSEVEYYTKYELDLEDNVDVNRVTMDISTFSHHLVIYRFNDAASAGTVAPGLRKDVNHF